VNRRDVLCGLAAISITSSRLASANANNAQRLADAARAQLGVTMGYDPTWTRLSYPNGDVPRSTGVCADVVIRAARDGLGLDLQKLVHEDMVKAFDAYPARKAWGSRAPTQISITGACSILRPIGRGPGHDCGLHRFRRGVMSFPNQSRQATF
jgi:uncharacterized protein